MQRLTTILLSIWMALLGAGALGHFHKAGHASPTPAASMAEAVTASGSPSEHVPLERRGDADAGCTICFLLQSPTVAWDCQTLVEGDAGLARLGSPIAAPRHACRVPARIDCRGPPAC